LPKEIDNRWETLIYQGFAPYLSHIPATFCTAQNNSASRPRRFRTRGFSA